MPPVAFEPTISAGQQPAASRIGAPYIHIHTYIYIYIYEISSLRVNDLTLILLMWRKW
jgi:hypothetical protein